MAGAARRKVELLFPEQTRIERLVKEDEDRFLQAVEKAVGPFLRVGHDRDRPVAELPEPVGDPRS